MDTRKKIQECREKATRNFEVLSSFEDNTNLTGLIDEDRVLLQKAASEAVDLHMLVESCQLGEIIGEVINEKANKITASEKEILLEEILKGLDRSANRLGISGLGPHDKLHDRSFDIGTCISMCGLYAESACRLFDDTQTLDTQRSSQSITNRPRSARKRRRVGDEVHLGQVTSGSPLQSDLLSSEDLKHETTRQTKTLMNAITRLYRERGESAISFWRLAIDPSERDGFSRTVETIFLIFNVIHRGWAVLLDGEGTEHDLGLWTIAPAGCKQGAGATNQQFVLSDWNYATYCKMKEKFSIKASDERLYDPLNLQDDCMADAN